MEERKKGLKWSIAVMAVAVSLLMASGCSSSNKDADTASSNAKSNMSTDNSGTDSSAAMDKTSSTESASVEQSDQSAEPTSNTAAEHANAAGASFGSGLSSSDSTLASEEGMNRKVIYRSNVSMEVGDYAKAQTLLKNIIHVSGSYLLQFADQKTSSEIGGTYTIKVPPSSFDTFLTELEKIKIKDGVFEKTIQGTDVSEEYVDLESRLKARQVVEARLLSFMEKAVKSDDLLRISSELGGVQTEIEQIKGRMRYLDKNVAFSTVELRMYQQMVAAAAVVKEENPAFLDRLQNAMSGSTKVIYAFVQGLFIFLAGALPVLLLVAILGIPVYYAYRSNRRRAAAAGAGTGTAVRVEEQLGLPDPPLTTTNKEEDPN
ncbi:DUF4349 domain-containing protein [Paenibacillus solisilvae]|uniref:DUF4349 domain-containing protein n=1 Tax=Paenibacillus solisilvae TaxID=2486751 RepID=A0ABW0W1D8_9BACL